MQTDGDPPLVRRSPALLSITLLGRSAPSAILIVHKFKFTFRCSIAHVLEFAVNQLGEGALHKWGQFIRSAGVLAFLGAFGTCAAQPAFADGSVSSSGMGYGAGDAARFKQFLAVVQQYNASGERFRIDSYCRSACTMFLAIRNVCVEPGATLAFHAGGPYPQGPVNPQVTRVMLNHYKPALQKYVTTNHFMDTFAFHEISGSDMIHQFGYRACN